MSENQLDRPLRPQRTKPRPAPYAGVDPVDPTPAEGRGTAPVPAAAPATPAAPSVPSTPSVQSPQERQGSAAGGYQSTGAGSEPTVQLNSRVAVGIGAIVERVKRETGKTKREIIEEAITALYGSR